MANDESVLREVDQELAEDRQWEFFRKNGPMVLGGAATIIIAVGGWQVWDHQKTRAAEESAVAFHEGVDALEKTPEEGRAALSEFREKAPAGYGVLADLRRAASLAGGGERLSALELYRKVYADGGTPKRLKHLARLRAGLLSLEDGRDAVMQDLGDLESDTTAIGFYAREVAAVAALDAGDFETAKNMFDRAAVNLDAPEPVRLRAEELSALAAGGKAGANVTRDLQVEDLSKTLDLTAPDVASDVEGGDEHTEDDGHGHENDPAEEDAVVPVPNAGPETQLEEAVTKTIEKVGDPLAGPTTTETSDNSEPNE